MTREEQHDLKIARKEIEFYSVLINELYNQGCNFITAKKELKRRGLVLENEEHFNIDNHWQVDVFGTFVAFTLVEHEGRMNIGYGWSLVGKRNIDLYEWGVGDFRPYYDKKSREEWNSKR